MKRMILVKFTAIVQQQIQLHLHLLQSTSTDKPSGYISLIEIPPHGELDIIEAENWTDFCQEISSFPYYTAWQVKNLSAVTRFALPICKTINQHLDDVRLDELFDALEYIEEALKPFIIKEIDPFSHQ